MKPQYIFINCPHKSWTAWYNDMEFSEMKIELLPTHLEMYQEMNDLDEQNPIRLARFCQCELRNDPEFFKRVVLSYDCKMFSIWLCQQAKPSEMGLGTFKWSLSSAKQGSLCYGWVPSFKLRVAGAFSLKTKMWQYRQTNGFFCTTGSLNFESTQKTPYLTGWSLSAFLRSCVVGNWTQSTSFIRWRVLAAFCGLVDHRIWRPMTTFDKAVWKILYSMSLSAQFWT